MKIYAYIVADSIPNVFPEPVADSASDAATDGPLLSDLRLLGPVARRTVYAATDGPL
jgi:hypothetical protein